MTQLPGTGPLAEGHLPGEPGLDPVHPVPPQCAAVERGLRTFQAGQRLGQAGQGGLTEASADT